MWLERPYLKEDKSMKAIGTFLTTLALANTLSGAVSARVLNIPVNCHPAPQVFEHFSKEQKQAPEKWGVSPDGKVVVHIWRDAGGDNFSIIVTAVNGQACVLFTGNNWQDIIWHLPKGPKT
jgi:hypothetical protein